jgi:hypothetical protein
MSSPDELRAKSKKCRQLAKGADDLTRANLLMLAEAYEEEAAKLEPDAEPPNPAS